MRHRRLLLGWRSARSPPTSPSTCFVAFEPLHTRAGALWLLGAASALAIGVWSSQVIGIAADSPPFTLDYHGLGTFRVWAVALVAGLAGLGAVSGRVATFGRVGFGAVALGIGAVGTHALALAPLGRGPGRLRRAPADVDRRAVPHGRPPGDGVELDRHRAYPEHGRSWR